MMSKQICYQARNCFRQQILHPSRLKVYLCSIKYVSSISNASGSNLNKTQMVKEKNIVSITRRVTQEDVEMFCHLTGDYNPVHTSRHGVVHGALLNGLVSGVIGTKLPGPGTLVVSQTLSFPNPCYVGEDVTVTIQIKEWRKIVTCTFDCTAGNDRRVVVKGEAKLVVKQT